MNYLEIAEGKICMVAKYLFDLFAVAPKEEAIAIMSKPFTPLPQREFVSIVSKLAQDFDMIEIHKDWYLEEHPSDKQQSSFVCIASKKVGFDKHLSEMRAKFQKQHPSAIVKKNEDKKAMWLSRDAKGNLVLNDVFLITKTREGFNDRLLHYLIENPNQTLTRDKLIANNVIKEDATKDFYTFFQDIKLGDELRALFFPEKHLSNKTIYLKNPILFKDLKENKLDFIDLNKLLKFKKQDKN